MTKKLKILGPYTPEHPGPFCTRDGYPVKIITKTEGSQDFPIVGLVHDASSPSCWHETGRFYVTVEENDMDLMNAEEVPVAREFWVNEYEDGMRFGNLQTSLERAAMNQRGNGYIRTIHVREVPPEDFGGGSAGVNWPSPNKPGEPMFHDQDGWHWLRDEESGGVYPLKWFCRKGDSRAFWDGDGRKIFPHLMAGTSYVGVALVPVQTPEVPPEEPPCTNPKPMT